MDTKHAENRNVRNSMEQKVSNYFPSHLFFVLFLNCHALILLSSKRNLTKWNCGSKIRWPLSLLISSYKRNECKTRKGDLSILSRGNKSFKMFLHFHVHTELIAQLKAFNIRSVSALKAGDFKDPKVIQGEEKVKKKSKYLTVFS